MLAADPTIPWSAIIAAFVLVGGGILTWVAYVAKQLVEHAKWMAAANVSMERVIEDVADVRAEQSRVAMELARQPRR